MKKLVYFLLLIPLLSFGQYEKEIDSLYKIINSNIKPEKKADAYGQLLEITFETNPEKAPEKIQELYHLNKNGNCAKCETMADFYTASYNDISGNRDAAIAHYEKAAQKSLKIKDYEFYQLAKTFKIYTYFNVGDLPNAERELADYFAVTKKLQLETGYEEMYYVRGLIYRKKGFLNTAIESLLRADQIIVDTKLNKMRLRVNVLDEISLTYKDLNNYKKAIEYNTKSLEESKRQKDTYGEMTSELMRGRIEVAFQNYQNAIKHLETAKTYFKSLNDINYLLICELNLGIAYYYLNQYSVAESYLKSAVTGLKKTESIDNYALSLSYLAQVNLVFKQFDTAKQNIDLAKSVVKNKENFPFYILLIDTEIDYYKKTNNYAAAFDRIKKKDSLSKVIAQKSNISNLNEFEAKYQSEKKGQQIKLLSAQNEVAQKQKYISVGLLLVVALIGAGIFYVYKNRIKTAEKLHELNELKSKFFANISHEFRTPLTLIKSPVQSLRSKVKDNEQLGELELINKNADRMLELVDQMLELSKIDSGHLKLLFKDGDVGSFLSAIIEPFAFQAKERAMHFETSIQKIAQNNSFDKDVIEKIVTNLLTNAFKYTPENEAIRFTSSINNGMLKIIVSNTGSTVQKDNLPQFFERFYQNNEQNPGVGIGLALVKELVALYDGAIETQLNNGELSFVVSLPMAVANENAIVIPTKSEVNKIENRIDLQAELPIVLLVDDNADIRKILRGIFEQEYTILEAQDGEEALKIAQREIPDCIISDVMMPKMDGFAFTSAIKNNELTSFIPIILLTAKTSDQAHLEGLKSTADAFLTKPFNNDIVKGTVQQLIAERKKLHKRYSQELVLKPIDIVVHSLDQKFIGKLQIILEKELDNSEFSAEDFAVAIGLSRMQLHRKLKTLLGVSATEFIRNERIKAAADLLKKGKGTVSEIAYATGFNNISYFSKCFKEMYLVTPSEYLNSENTL